MMDVSRWLVIFLLGCLCWDSNATSYTDETRLFNNLTTGYNACVRPSLPTTVNVYYSIKTLENLNIATQSMKTTGWLTLTWTDSRLTWTPSDFSNIEALEIDFSWRPKFVIANQVDAVIWHGVDTTVFRIFNDGTVRWSVPLLTETSCDVDILLFPFDTQTCNLEMNFWTVSDSEIQSVLYYSQVDTTYYSENGEWKLMKSSAEKQEMTTCCPQEKIPTYVFSLTYQRKRQYYVTNLLLPTLLMSFVVVWTFILPTESGERMGFSLTVLLAYTVTLTLTAGMLPTTSKQMPHIAIYLLVVLIMCTTSVAFTVINVKMYNSTGTPPRWLQRICARIRPCLFLDCSCKKRSTRVASVTSLKVTKGQLEKIKVIKKEAKDDDDNVPSTIVEDLKMTWPQIADVIDRFLFFGYFMVIICLNIMFITFLIG